MRTAGQGRPRARWGRRLLDLLQQLAWASSSACRCCMRRLRRDAPEPFDSTARVASLGLRARPGQGASCVLVRSRPRPRSMSSILPRCAHSRSVRRYRSGRTQHAEPGERSFGSARARVRACSHAPRWCLPGVRCPSPAMKYRAPQTQQRPEGGSRPHEHAMESFGIHPPDFENSLNTGLSVDGRQRPRGHDVRTRRRWHRGDRRLGRPVDRVGARAPEGRVCTAATRTAGTEVARQVQRRRATGNSSANVSRYRANRVSNR